MDSVIMNGATITPRGWEDLPQNIPLRAYVADTFQGLARAGADGIRMILFLEEDKQSDG